MEKIIDCFVPRGNEEETKRNVDMLGAEELVNSVTVVDANIKASATLKDIAGKATAPYTVLFLKGQFIQLGYLALNRMVQIADITKAGMTYADHYNISADGKRTEDQQRRQKRPYLHERTPRSRPSAAICAASPIATTTSPAAKTHSGPMLRVISPFRKTETTEAPVFARTSSDTTVPPTAGECAGIEKR